MASHARVDGRRRTAFLHRLVTGCPHDKCVDHINGNTLDNRRCNLRVAEHWQNRVNSVRRSETGFRGVRVVGDGRAWIAKAKLHGITYYGGTHPTAEDAARAYDRLALQLHGEFALLNFPAEAALASA